MFPKNLNQLYSFLPQYQKIRIAVAMPEDEQVLQAVSQAVSREIADFLLCGNPEKIRQTADMYQLDLGASEILEADGPEDCARLAVSLIHSREADLLMKGSLESSVFLKAVFHSRPRLCLPERLLTSIALMEHASEERFFLISDPGFIANPDYTAKKSILKNAVAAAHLLGIDCPKVALLSASETVNPHLQSSLDARRLWQDWENGEFPSCIVCGPISFDLAMNPDACRHKNYSGAIQGDADILIMPSLEAGNIAYKAIEYFSRLRTGGIVMGASCPIIFTSRADSFDTKLNTIALAAYLRAKGGAYDV